MGMIHAAKVLATTAAALMEDPVLIEAAKVEQKAMTRNRAYSCPIPPEVQPPSYEPQPAS